MSRLSQQPTEVLEHIIDELDGREDLLSLALVCARLRDIIVTEHLPYRRIVVSVYFQPFFEHIVSRPDLGRRVRELTLVNTSSDLVIPRGHIFRTKSAGTNLTCDSDSEDDVMLSNVDAKPWQPLDVPILVENALRRLLRLRRLGFRGKTEQLPFERILAFHHGRLEGLALDSKEGSDGILRPFGSPPTHLWKMSGMKSLELDVRLRHTYWNPFCAILDRSPMLETLVMPWFDPGPITFASFASMPPLSHLKRITVREVNLALDGDGILSHRIYTFLNDHPTIQEVIWKGRAGYPTRMPRLPATRRMLNINHAHVLELLHKHCEGEYVVFDLDTVAIANVKLAPRWTWSSLSSIFPSSLRALHIAELQDDVESNEMLDTLARIFVHLQELHLPEHGSHYVMKRLKSMHTYPPTRFTATRLEIIDEGVKRPALSEVVGRFTRLRIVSGVDAGLDAQTLLMTDYVYSNSLPMEIDVKKFLRASRVLVCLRTQFPQLHSVNGWQLDTDLSEMIVLAFPRDDGLMRVGAIQVVLRRQSICVQYSGTQTGSQPLPLQLKRLNTILGRTES